jgi:hypothetical protein
MIMFNRKPPRPLQVASYNTAYCYFRDVPDIRSYRISGRIIAIRYPVGTGYHYPGGAVLPVKDCSVLAGDVLTDSRSRLLPDRAEHLIFLKINLPIPNFNCTTVEAESDNEYE